MSHFNTAVFTRYPGELEGLLAPFDENVDSDSPYAEFVEDEDGELDAETGKLVWVAGTLTQDDGATLLCQWHGLLRKVPRKQ